MKTLDEVINIFEKACDLEKRCEECNGCLSQENGCPNDGAEAVPDALHYLKEYREKLNILTLRMAEYKRGFEQLGVEWSRIKENPALTWDELRQMVGKPVWVEYMDDEQQTGWALIVKNPERPTFGKPKLFTFVRDGGRFYLTITGYGKRWQAYRKERKNASL